MKKLLATLLASAALATLTMAPAQAEDYDFPCDTAELIVPWGPGGGTHVLFSIMEKYIAEMGAKPALKVVTQPGQGGNKGAKQAARAAADGCTLFAIHQSAITSYLNGRIDFQYDGFETIANMTVTPDIIGAAADVPFHDFAAFKAYAEANPGAIKAGTTFGSTSHFIWLLLAQKMGVEFSYVPYDGTAERMNALLSGAIDVGALNVASGLKHFESGALQGFAIAADARDPQVPDMPTLKELGVDMTFALERGVVAPLGTPKAAIDHWAGVFEELSKNEAFLAEMDAKGTGIRYQGPDDFRAWAEDVYGAYEAVAIEIGMYKKDGS